MRLVSELTGGWVYVDESAILGAGGEGRVFGLTGAAPLAAKIFDELRPEREAKLRVMLANTPAQPGKSGHTSLAWPLDLLLDGFGGPVVGYLMPRVRDCRVIDDYYNPQARLEHCPLFHYEYLMVVARNLAAAMRSLHSRGYVVGDVKQSNILVTPNALVTLVDTDSFQVFDESTGVTYRCPVGSPEYTPPELQGLAAPRLLSPEHDLFGLAVLLFQLLMEGTHPFAGVYTGEEDPPPLGDRIRNGWFPYGAMEPADTSGGRRPAPVWPGSPISPSRKALPFRSLAPHVQSLFLRCFATGDSGPGRRPSAHEWQQALDAARGALVRCAANEQHRYSPHLDACPWCERRATVLRGRDPYPTAAEAQRLTRPAVPPMPAPSFAASPTPAAWNVAPQRTPWTGKSHSGWFAYAIAALGLPVVLGLVSSNEARQLPLAPPPFVMREPLATTAPVAPVIEDDLPSAPVALANPAKGWGPVYLAAVEPSLSADGRFAAIAADSTTAALLDSRSGDVVGLVRPSDRRASLDSVAVAPSGALLAAADRNALVLWERDSASVRYQTSEFGVVRALAFSPSGAQLAVARSSVPGDTLVTVVDARTGEPTRSYSGSYGEMVVGVRYSPDGKRLFASTLGNAEVGATLYCWNAATGDLVWRLSKKSWSPNFVISPDSKTVAVGGWELDLRNAANGDQISDPTGTGEPIPNAEPLCYSPDGRVLAMTSHGELYAWRIGDITPLRSPLPPAGVEAAVFSANGSYLTTLSPAGGLERWDVATRSRVTHIPLKHPTG
jgi:outer membrane protein assembly factor BamB